MTDPAPPRPPMPASSGLPPSPAPRRRWLMGAALFVSLALNLLVLGLVLGALWGRDGPMSARTVRIDLGTVPHVVALDERDRAALRRDWEVRGPDLRRIRAQRQAELEALATAIRAEPFEPAAVTALLEAAQARTAERQVLLLELVAARITAMSAAERAAYADRLEAAARRTSRRPMEGRVRPD